MNESIKRTTVRVEGSYEVPPGYTEDDIEVAVLEPFGAMIGVRYIDVADDKRWVTIDGTPVVIDLVDTEYLAWRKEIAQSVES
jgi:hypothetical protein